MKNVTSPAGEPPFDAVTVAVIVIAWPAVEGLGPTVTVVVVAIGETGGPAVPTRMFLANSDVLPPAAMAVAESN